MWLLLAVVCADPCGAQGVGTTAEPLRLHYQERPPYSATAATGQPQGLLIEPLQRALHRAQIAHVFVRTPSQRQLLLVQQGHQADCGIGWFRNAEREAHGRYSAPLYQDRPYMALVRTDAAWDPARSLAQRLQDGTSALLVKDGYSYGPQLDALIRQHPGQVLHTTAESAPMARMIEARRAGWMVIAPEEADALFASIGDAARMLRLVPLAGAPAGQTRHLYCNTAVPAQLVERLDRALREQ